MKPIISRPASQPANDTGSAALLFDDYLSMVLSATTTRALRVLGSTPATPATPATPVAQIMAQAVSRAVARVTAKPAPASASQKLACHLESGWNYRRIKRDVSRWGKAHRSHAAAFVSTALTRVDVHVPRDLVIDGLSASFITWGLSRYLEDHAGWCRVRELDTLCEGDIVFTEDAPCCPGIPHHVFVFMGWHDRARALAYVSDNHGSRVVRSLRGADSASSCDHHSATDSRAAYALRAPTTQRQAHQLARAAA